MAQINFLSKRARQVLLPEQFLENTFSVDRASEIFIEVFDEFMEEIESINSQSNLLFIEKAELVNTGTRGRFRIKTVIVEVTGYVYNLLDNGWGPKVFDAEDYTVTAPSSPRYGEPLKAFPLLVREGVGTYEDSMELYFRPALEHDSVNYSKYESDGLPYRNAGDPVIFRESVTVGYEARNFTKHIAAEAQKRINREGIPIQIEVENG